jgi:hypothetical protein
MTTTMRSICLAAAALLACAGCAPTLGGVSGAAPGITLRHDYKVFDDDVITMTKGTAYALDCWDAWDGSACDNVSIASGDSKIVDIVPSHMERTTNWYGETRRIPARPGFIVTANGRGESFVTVTGPGGETRLRVIVE